MVINLVLETLIVSTDNQWCNVQKCDGNQLQNTSYRVKTSECYKVPIHSDEHTQYNHTIQESSEDEEEHFHDDATHPPVQPDVSSTLATPAPDKLLVGPITQPSHLMTVSLLILQQRMVRL